MREEPVDMAGSSSRPETVRIRLDVAYDGSAFHGFAENPGVSTVAGELHTRIERIVGSPVVLTCAGRTDRGVHGRGQVVTFDAPPDRVDTVRLARSLNRMLAPRIVVRAAAVVPSDFDARFSARWRSYHYRILNAPVPDPLTAGSVWWVPEPLSVEAMRAACPALLGEHDFSSFCRRPKGEAPDAPLRRRVLHADWERASGEVEGDLLVFHIRATAFCHQMVRSITGMLVEVGMGRKTPGDVRRALLARDRSAAGRVAPPEGLVLWEVGY